MKFPSTAKASTISFTRKATALAFVAILLSACTSIYEIKNTRVYKPTVIRDGSVNIASRATGMESNIVGKVTMFGDGIGDITVEGDVSASIMNSVSDAIVATGYNSQNGTSFSSVDAGYLKAHVESMTFGNFLFSSWGTIILHLRLETREGDILWKDRIRTKVHTVTSYERTAHKTMNKLVKDMINIFSGEEFYRATKRIKRHNDFLKDKSLSVSS